MASFELYITHINTLVWAPKIPKKAKLPPHRKTHFGVSELPQNVHGGRYSSVSDSSRATTLKMPPKRAGKKKGISRCTHNNRGYCKLKEECKDKHFEEVCDNFDCDEDNCEKRHPNPCNFGPRCRFNERKEC